MEDPMEAVIFGGGDRASGGEDSTFAPLTAMEQSGKGTEKVY